ncbi:NAD(P)/FAD-dependent oxidoreductase [Candidatus Omnitrophota bacterium]
MKKIVIIGSSAAGIAAVEEIRKRNKQDKVVMISDESYPAYCRCLISYFLAGDIKEKGLIYRDERFFKDNNIELLLGKKAVEIRPKKNIVVIQEKNEKGDIKKTQVEYDYLILANGASPKFPDKKGMKKKGVFGFRTVEDATRISELLPITTTACVLGGGLIGLKAAYALRKRGPEVKVIIRSKQVLSQVLDQESAYMFQQRIEENGIEVITGTDVAEVIGNGDAKAIKLDSGKVIGCPVIVVGKGVQSNIDLVKETDIEVGEGIVVNDNMCTNIPNIFAAGDVCETYDPALNQRVVNALWPNAVQQGKIAGANVAGEKLIYDGSMGVNSVEFFNLAMISMGITRTPKDGGYQELTKRGDGFYKKLVLRDNLLVGGIFVGKLDCSGVYLELIKKKADVSGIIDELMKPNFSYANAFDLLGSQDSIYLETIKA